MRGGSVAKRYATALIRVAQETGKLEAIQKELEAVNLAMVDNPELKGILESPIVKPSQKTLLWGQIQNRLKMTPYLDHLLQILIDQKRVGLLPLIGLLYRDMADEWMGQVRVKVKTAVALGAHQNKLQALLEKSLGKKVLLEVQTDPSLLAGFVIQIQDKVFDATLKRDLERLQESIEKQAVA